LVKHDLVRGLKDAVFEKDKLCSSCQAGKQVKNVNPKKSIMSTSKTFKLLHIDLFGSTQYTRLGGNKYDFVIVDGYTRYTWAFFLVDKSDVFTTFKSFVKSIHNEFETTIKRVRSDNHSKFNNTRIDELILELDINS
jgi:5'-3' exoribonuclease 2